MKNVVIFADGALAKQFLTMLIKEEKTGNKYVIVYYQDATLPDVSLPENRFELMKLDPTSPTKIEKIFTKEYAKALIVMENENDSLQTYKNIRAISARLYTSLLTSQKLNFPNDQHLQILNTRKFLASKLFNYLPGIPVTAQYVGIGQGEIMEVSVPSSSSYAYRHIGNISQKNWRISAIYRKNKFIFPTREFMIRPNDTLLCVGRPEVLSSVYQRISNQTGQFPLPYGKNIYIVLDMFTQSDEQIKDILKQSLQVQNAFKNSSIVIKVINPTVFSNIYHLIKNYENKNTSVIFDFKSKRIREFIEKDRIAYDVGLVITDSKLFDLHKKTFFGIKTVILKLGNTPFKNLKKSVIFTASEEEGEKISSVVHDISSQMSLEIDLQCFQEDSETTIEHYENLSKIYSQKLNIIKNSKNPIFGLKKSQNNLFFFRFTKNILKNRLNAYFTTSTSRFYFHFENSHQILTPTVKSN
ncbi:MAG: Potassium transporter TrkA [uncultured Campylobacterales bacterium]|uniref:Potassium transporter TrkA n=1 Tax=uncultured Campylobacterales bacterium TaxID=352960 RepID=A0A6S6T3L0_9BACT|nr:MAG: Potassium transporter TrkA [uncultured Campylobacterales bacterium]